MSKIFFLIVGICILAIVAWVGFSYWGKPPAESPEDIQAGPPPATTSPDVGGGGEPPVVTEDPVAVPEETPAITVEIVEASQASVPQGSTSEIIVYASDLPDSALFELDFYDDEASPGKKLIGLPNNGDELDPPPENDPHVTFNAQVQSGIPYRCWIHMKVGTPKGRSQANTIWVQFSDAVDEANKEVLKPNTNSYLTAQGPIQEGWIWVGCDLAGSDSLVYFTVSGEITVRLQAGAEGVGFDQFILSSAEFLEEPPSVPVVEK